MKERKLMNRDRLEEAYDKLMATERGSPEEQQAWDELVDILFEKAS